MELVTAVSWLGTATGVVLLSAPITAVRDLAASGDVGAVTCSYYVVQLLNCTSWVVYGLLVEAYAVAVSNLWGALVAIYCILVFMHTLRIAEIAGKKNPWTTYINSLRRVKIIVMLIMCLLLTINHVLQTYGRQLASHAVGTFSGFTGVLMLAAPLERIRHIITTKSATVLSVHVTFWGIVNRSTWVCFAIMAHDRYILVPNSIGLLVGGVSGVLLCWFRASRQSKTISQMV
ncbi:sugar efflux transporter, putative [Bodo saltans]|uniref:Sugar efflux transporter, putative n=1 Tax=Bodo saltans TaxID=75058 RepID=A0A0S4JK63_BODSA|nr:sugar efflux transporter, putative [Bodo saltans]|eukprot:CUG91889.1 sugar efflux transporter, putative [Bodo saltans]